MFAKLRTRCGCEKILVVEDFRPLIRIPLIMDLPLVDPFDHLDMITAIETSVREFEYHGRIGPESAEYRERVPRPTESIPRKVKSNWTPSRHPLIQLDEELRKAIG